MRTTRLYHPDELRCDERVRLGSMASAHLVRVLRAKTGYPIILFNGNGRQYRAELIDANPRKALVHIIEEQLAERESPLKVTLVQGISRNDRMEVCLQKATELGVHQLAPVVCERSNVKLTAERQKKKQAHWQSVIISACEQSGRNTLPAVTNLQTFHDYLDTAPASRNKLFLHPDADDDLASLRLDGDSNNSDEKNITVLIGPEGGLSQQEIDALVARQWQGVRMGPRILRTETAGPAVIAVLQYIAGDFRND